MERHYDGRGAVSTATELHHTATPMDAQLLLLRVFSDWPDSSITPPRMTQAFCGTGR